MTNEFKTYIKHPRRTRKQNPSSSIRHPHKKNLPDARKTALYILNDLDHGNKTLDSILQAFSDRMDLLSKKDRSLLNALVYGVIRWRGRLDHIIDCLSNIPIARIEPKALNIIRMGLFQIIYLSRIPVSAAVNTSVELAKSFAPPWVIGFVNAMLRNAVNKFETVPFPDPEKDPVSAIAVHNSFPKWLIKRWILRYGDKETAKLCEAINVIPPITIRTNTLKTTRGNLLASLKKEVVTIKRTAYSPDGISLVKPNSSIPEMKSFKDGWFVVQDEAAQLVTLLLGVHPGDTVLDACAGLGGKTGHIAQIMKNQGTIFALDKDERKLSRLVPEMKRLRISIVTPLTGNLEKPLDIKGVKLFDRILLDAPCSGMGVIRRNPDIKWATSKINLSRYKKKQLIFLKNIASLVKPSGILVYTVCSLEPEENEEVVEEFLSSYAEFDIKNISTMLSYGHDLGVSKDMYLKTLPHKNNMDGFFAVCFQKKAV
ncbi:MAG: 16S rRNA (cytosine(967)-C(5))-methyltransferase RsmB [Thermodesulfobacteriota bacterium]|nr:16S rRNA (cytosine(967)-C(5))-methyltransferase RsmB [Thermodesulfobacteriota bacterium]